tara:strand:+ start:10142 stop:10432 length:291 start_codon:yes stop_codon:yes gene_type:complete
MTERKQANLVPFGNVPYGANFAYLEKKMLKLTSELCNFDDLCDGQRVRTKIVNETTGYKACGRPAIVYNSVDLDTGNLYSVLDDVIVHLFDKESGV